ncbi:hypothetical protein [Streptomyces acidicola]|uniref:hypothetical protein n=1 Tax=Streptomyces acidicola TaxID=2596892 RepID=UPI00342B708A
MEHETRTAPVSPQQDFEDFCRVCGYDRDRYFENGVPTSAICDCCGSEPELERFADEAGTWEGVRFVHSERGWWLGRGALWERPRDKPCDWDLVRQVQNLPEAWRTPPPPPVDRAHRIATRESNGSLGTESTCRICGLTGPLFWDDGVPTETVCPCCGFESGIDDLAVPGEWNSLSGIRTLRGYWVALGAPWSSSNARPADWDILRQLGNLPVGWR